MTADLTGVLEGLAPEFRTRFEPTILLGSGTFGAVFRARDRQLNRPVVIKLLRPEHGDDPNLVERFRREAEAMARLAHPRVVPLLDHGRSGDCHYLISPDLGGRSLEQELRGTLPLAPGEASLILGEILEGLEVLHEADLVHRDLKPANVLRLEDGHLALIDLGLAGSVGSEGTLTATGQVVGTAAYLAPEQIRGEAPSPSADLYAVGVLAYLLLTGDNPFQGLQMAQTLQNHLTLEPDPPHRVRDDVSPAFSGWVLDLLEKSPRDRPASASAALLELRRVVTPGASPARGPRDVAEPLGAGELPLQASGRRRRSPAAVLAILAGLSIATWWATLPKVDNTPEAQPMPARRIGPPLPAELPSLATRELDGIFDRRENGSPVLDPDPASWGRNLRHLTVPSRFHAWLADGGRPEELTDETLQSLRAVDSNYRALGLPAPFGPFLVGPPADEPARFVAASWREWPIPPEIPEVLAAPIPGWLGEAYRVAEDLEARRLHRGVAIRRAIEEGDADAGPEGFLGQWRLLVLARTRPLPERPLSTLFRYYVTSSRNRQALVEWFGEDLELFRRSSYLVARAVRERPDQADRAAILYSWWTDRFRSFARGAASHTPPEFTLGFVPDGPQGAHLGLALLEIALDSRIELHDQEVPGEAPAFLQEAISVSGETPVAKTRRELAFQDGLFALGSTGQLTGAIADVVGLHALVRAWFASEPGRDASSKAGQADLVFDIYAKILRTGGGQDRERARRDLDQLSPELVERAPSLEGRLRTLLEAPAPQSSR